jgi:aryl-alcohol dehydrogenase-like predicted oxidoreductase
VNWIDTAAAYGLGHSEEVIGRAMREIPLAERPFVFTKCGLVWEGSSSQPRRVANPASVRREVDASLRRLGVERIDLYQVHWPSEDGTPIEEYWGALVELRAEGKVRAIGLSNHDVPLLERAHRVGRVDSVQPPFSMIRRDAAAELIPWCSAHDVGVIVYSPMQAGLLSGSFTADRVRKLPAGDWRAGSARFSGEALERGLALAEALRPIAARHDTTVAAVAVAWTLAWPGVTGAIVGARRPSQVDGWIGAATLMLDDADLDEVAAAIERTGAGSGPVRPARRRTALGSAVSPE